MCGFGCLLKKIITLIILTFAAIGFVKVGAWDFCKENFMKEKAKPEQETTKVPSQADKRL